MAYTNYKSDTEKALNDLITLQSVDNPRMQLVSVQMDGMNYLSWNRAVIIALQAKDELGFIDGKEKMPEPDSNL